jgi:hypothetical protein
MSDEGPFYCPAQTMAPRMYVDPTPAEYCETEVEEAGDYCARHEDLDEDPWGWDE